jgi:hypothetical protein
MKKEDKIGILSLILSLIAFILFVIIYWSLETRIFWDFTKDVFILYVFDLVILISLIIGFIFGKVSTFDYKPRSKFGVLGIIFTIVTVLFIVILIVPMIFTPIY